MKKTVAIIGYPIGHSISPAMHNAAYEELDSDYEYVPMEVAPKDLEKKVNELRQPTIAGFNVTVPHKEAIVPLLDDLTKMAKIIGAVNTVKNDSGKLIGYNTDGAGFIESLKEDAGINPKGKRVLLLGAGGAARAVAVMLAEAKVHSLQISDIAEEKADKLAEYLAEYFGIEARPAQNLNDAISEIDILVNATPIGMHPKINNCPLSDGIQIPSGIIVYDLVYTPQETLLLKRAKEAGAKPVSGLGMLVRQGALAFTIFTGREAPIATMWQAAKSHLA